MKNLDNMKQSICEQIQNMDAEALFDFICVLEEFGGRLIEEDVLSLDKVLICARCKELFGNCDEILSEDKCLERFKKHCEQTTE